MTTAIATPTAPAKMVPSRYQQAIYDFVMRGYGNLMVDALAGSGKSTTIREAVMQLPYWVRRDTIILAFNSSIAKEMSKKMAGSGATVKTNHGLGYAALIRANTKKVNTDQWVNDRKERQLYRYWLALNPSESQDAEEKRREEKAVTTLTGFLKVTLTDETDEQAVRATVLTYGLEDITPRVIAAARQVIEWSVTGTPTQDKEGLRWNWEERISFDDMIWLPLRLNLPVQQFHLVFVDEAQDLNAAQRTLAMRAMKPEDGRFIAVGDVNQAIYGFTGADANSFAEIARATQAERLPLSVCYRCPKSVIRLAQKIVPAIEWGPNAEEGIVAQIAEHKMIEMAGPEDMVLCRMNAPLVSLAFGFIAAGKPAKVKGRDIGASLSKMIDAIKLIADFDFGKFIEFAEFYRQMQAALIAQKGEDGASEMESLNDRVDSILAVYGAAVTRGARDTGDLKRYIDDLFVDDTDAILLSSVHKAKGLEANRVFIVKPEMLPSGKAKKDWEIEQERNLAYVAVTRAMRELYTVDGPLAFQGGYPAQSAPLPEPEYPAPVTGPEAGPTPEQIATVGRAIDALAEMIAKEEPSAILLDPLATELAHSAPQKPHTGAEEEDRGDEPSQPTAPLVTPPHAGLSSHRKTMDEMNGADLFVELAQGTIPDVLDKTIDASWTLRDGRTLKGYELTLFQTPVGIAARDPQRPMRATLWVGDPEVADHREEVDVDLTLDTGQIVRDFILGLAYLEDGVERNGAWAR